MINYFKNIYSNIYLEYSNIALFFLVCIFVIFAYNSKDFMLDASTDSFLLENDKDLQRYREIIDRYENQEFVFVAFTPNGDMFSDGNISTITRLRDELNTLELVDSVFSIVDVPLVKVVGASLTDVADNYKTLLDMDIDRVAAKNELVTSPIFLEQVISKDARTTALWVFLKTNEEFERVKTQRNSLLIRKYSEELSREEAELLDTLQVQYDAIKLEMDDRTHEMIIDIRDIISTYQDEGQLYLGGVPMVVDDMVTFIKNDLIIFGTGIFIFLVTMLGIIFRKVRWVLLPMASCIFAVTLMIGLLGIIGWKVTVISSNFISLMLILTMSMNVHLVIRYRQLNRDFPDVSQSELVLDTARRMVWPCLYTALTTMIGFGSLVVSGIKPVIDFGWMMTIGLAIIFLTTFLLFPAILMLMEKLPSISKEHKDVPFTASLARMTDHHGFKIILVSIILAVISIYGMSQLRVENSYVNYFDDSTEIYKGLKLIDDELGGTLQLDILLNLAEEENGDEELFDEDDEFDALFGDIEVDKADYWFTEDRIDLIKGVHDYLETHEPVGKVLSLASTVRLAESLIKAGEFDTYLLGIIYRQMPEELRKEMITPYVNVEEDELRITLRVRDSLKDLRRNELLQQIQRDLTDKFDLSDDQVELSGLMVLYNNMLQSLFQSQIMTLGVVMLGIAIMLLLLFQSFPLAVIGIIPNILTASLILGLMGLLDIPLDMMTITIAAITIGIAVDNSIHYIYRFREEYSRNGDYIQTLYICHANIGRAVFYTAITIIVGFSILIFSNFIPMIYFGLLTALAMFFALFAALTLLPKLILLWKPF